MELPLKIRSVPGLTDEMFFDLCQANSQLFLERDKEGNIIVMAPTGSDTGNYNFEFGFELGIWNRRTKEGYVFDSSTGFTLKNGAVHSPDISWIVKRKWDDISEADRKKFAPVCPDLVVEVMSLSDSLSDLKSKMEEYISNGSSLGWLIDRVHKQVYIYRADGSMEMKEGNSIKLSGEEALQDFLLDVWF